MEGYGILMELIAKYKSRARARKTVSRLSEKAGKVTAGSRWDLQTVLTKI